MDNLKFRGNDPGAAQYGNFINYYKFHSADERIKVLPKDIWKAGETSYCLDVGCNSGDLTLSFNEFLDKCGSNNHILGIDIDPILIQRAREKCSLDKIQFECVNIMDSNDFLHIQSYLTNNNLQKFNVVTCFSVTMWIHLNNGDDGLRTFLRKICDLGELIVIEPQPWKCYKTAVKRMKKCNYEFAHFKALKYRENIEIDIESILTFEFNRIKIAETKNTIWGRKLLFFR